MLPTRSMAAASRRSVPSAGIARNAVKKSVYQTAVQTRRFCMPPFFSPYLNNTFSTSMTEVIDYASATQERICPSYRVMDHEGKILTEKDVPADLNNKEQLVKIHKTYIEMNVLDSILYDVQRQGRISFYMTNQGEEATHIGTAAAIKSGTDIIYGQYRELGVFLWLGYTIDEIMDQCYSNRLSHGKGRQMPVHYGCERFNFHTISSPLGTQIPQAAGAAYAQKLRGEQGVTMCFFGDGAASEGDFHAALNFAATLDCPALFVCRNNGYAISTPVEEQYRGDGIISRALGYGMHAIRVDGNDVFAVYNATKYAREYALKHNAPVLIEAMTYRIGDHSTSDQSTRYRSGEDVQLWKAKYHPAVRMMNYLTEKGWYSAEEQATYSAEVRATALASLRRAEGEKKPSTSELFVDVYAEKEHHLLEQEAQLKEHLQKYPDHYPTDIYEK